MYTYTCIYTFQCIAYIRIKYVCVFICVCMCIYAYILALLVSRPKHKRVHMRAGIDILAPENLM